MNKNRRLESEQALKKKIGLTVRRIRERRGITQKQLASRTGVSYQQIQKYESGVNRISADALWMIATALNVPITTFFVGLYRYRSEPLPGADPDAQEAIEILKTIEDDRVRAAVLSFLRSLATPTACN